VIELDDIRRASIEVVALNRSGERQIHREILALQHDYGIDVRYAAIQATRGAAAAYPKIISVWDANRPIGFRDLIAATDLLYGGK
jgi:hypothetical protein